MPNNNENRKIEMYIDGVKVILPLTVELVKMAREEIAAGRATVDMNRELALKQIDSVISEPWDALPVSG